MKRFGIFIFPILLSACGDSTNSKVEIEFGEKSSENIRSVSDLNNNQVEKVTTAPVFINDKKLDPPPSPVSRLRKNFGSRQKRYSKMINRISRQYGVDPLLTHSIISQESWYRPTVGSPAGAVGLMQLIPQAGRRFGCANRSNAKCNVIAGVKYLKWLAIKFKGRGNIQTIASGYNAGEATAESYLTGKRMSGKNPQGRQTPNGVPVASFGYSINQKRSCNGQNSMPGYKCEGETYQYARNVAGYYLRYRKNPQLVGLNAPATKYKCEAREQC